MSEQELALVIEDNPDQALVFTQALREAGYVVETILDGQQAAVRLTEMLPGLVVLDLHMPLVSGEIILEQIRSDERLHQTRVILATADALLAARLRPQVDMVLLKPVSFIQLMQLAQRLYGRSRPTHS